MDTSQFGGLSLCVEQSSQFSMGSTDHRETVLDYLSLNNSATGTPSASPIRRIVLRPGFRSPRSMPPM